MNTEVEKPKKTSRLITFVPPTPSRLQFRILTPVNRWLFLGGIPLLRSIPFIGSIPGIRGLTNIPKIIFPKADTERLRRSVSDKNACFMVPNHPEFFTDWMLDKEIMSRLAPTTASWATHDIVNGMGKGAQKFWLRNNLIAQIPGAGGAAGKAYSVEWALAGKNVLLHPEGAVGWHGDLIGHLYTGAIDMAIEAAKRAEKDRQVLLAPIIWKLVYNRDVSRGLHKEMDYVESSLALPKTSRSDDLGQRLYDICVAILAKSEAHYGVKPTDAHFFERQDRLIAKLLPILGKELDALGAEPEPSKATTDKIRRGERWLRTVDRKSEAAKSVRALTQDLRLLVRFQPDFYTGPHITQEHIGESLKRIRSVHCKGTFKDTLNSFMPQPAGPRTAHIRVPEAILISADADVSKMLEELRLRLQATLDEINAELDAAGNAITYRNVFLQ
ncbi:MAG: hypothetical protein JKX71_05085 [Amylibacter sp.]|nr:hypothetical protein [Amylibacter sp.]